MDQTQIIQAQHYLWWFRQTYGGYPQNNNTELDEHLPPGPTIFLHPMKASQIEDQVQDTPEQLPGDFFENLVESHRIKVILPHDELEMINNVTVYNLSKRDRLTVSIDYDSNTAQLTASDDGSETSRITLPFFNEDGKRAEILTDFLQREIPLLFAQFRDGDGIMLGESYRNDGYFIFYQGKLLHLIEEDGFHDYGLPPRVVRPYYALNWLDYGFLADCLKRQTQNGVIPAINSVNTENSS